MAKQSRSVRQSHAVSNQGKGSSFEEHESYDDSLLPDSLELARLKELDPDIMQWIKERTEKEQDGRLNFNDRKMGLIENSTKKAFQIDLLTIVLAFLVIVCGMAFSYLLISKGQVVTGTIFAGATILMAANSFLNFRRNILKDKHRKD